MSKKPYQVVRVGSPTSYVVAGTGAKGLTFFNDRVARNICQCMNAAFDAGVAHGRKETGRSGGHAAAKSMTKEERSDRARHAARARWWAKDGYT